MSINNKKKFEMDGFTANLASSIATLASYPIGDEIAISPPHRGHVDVYLKYRGEVLKKIHVPLDGSDIY